MKEISLILLPYFLQFGTSCHCDFAITYLYITLEHFTSEISRNINIIYYLNKK